MVTLEPGHQIGSYVLARRLGEGGMAEVWQASRRGELGTSKRVAIKILLSGRARDEHYRQLFEDEIRLVMPLSSSNIVQVFDVGKHEGMVYMVMEYVEGMDLDMLHARTRAAGQRLSPRLSAYIVGEVLKALAYAHEFKHEGVTKTIIHRDVSPHNVMISTAGEVKLMDFGIARVASEETSGIHIKGKLRYMPPEQLQKATKHPTIDLFALGAVLHELLDGRRFRGARVTEERLMGMVFLGEIPALARTGGEIPGELEQLRAGLLEPDASKRIQSARAAHRMLSRWSGYGDARFELEDFIASLPTSPVKGLDAMATKVFAGTGSREEDPPVVDVSTISALHPSTEPDRLQASATRTGPSVSRRVRRMRPPVAVGLGGAGVAVGLTALGVLLADPKPDEPVSIDQAEQSTSGSASSDEAPVDEARNVEVTPPREPVEDLPRALESPPADESKEPKPATEPSKPAKRAKSTKRATKPVSISLRAPGRFYVEVKIRNKVHTIERAAGGVAKLRLRPGRYRVEFRDSPRGAWLAGGTMEIEPGGGSRKFTLQGASLTPD